MNSITTPQVKAFPATTQTRNTTGKLPPLPDQLPLKASTTSSAGTGSTEDDDGFCKTMADVEAYNLREEQERIAKGLRYCRPLKTATHFSADPFQSLLFSFTDY